MTTTPTQNLLRYFSHGHLPEHLQHIANECSDFAQQVEDIVPDGPEKTAGMRKLLEAKNCFVRASLEQL